MNKKYLRRVEPDPQRFQSDQKPTPRLIVSVEVASELNTAATPVA